jgi:hypothetical protein
LFSRGDWKFVAGDVGVETLWLLGPEGLDRYDEIDVELPAAQARAFDQGGYYVMRDGWWKDSSYALIDCGPLGVYNCGHAHADALAFEFAAQGTPWLVDPGTFTYTSDAETRNQFRETAAHNTVTVDGRSQSEPAGTFSWHHVASAETRGFITQPGFSFFEGAHDGYLRLEDPVIHTRRLLFLKQDFSESLPTYLIVEDDFKAHEQHTYQLNYHFPAGCSAVASNNQVRVVSPEGRKLAIQPFATRELKIDIRHGWVSGVYAGREAAPVATVQLNGYGAQKVMSFILPFTAKNQAMQVERQAAPGNRASIFTVTLDGSRDVVLQGDGCTPVETSELNALATLAWARFVGGCLLRACLIKGKALQVPGKFTLRSTEVIDHGILQVQADHLGLVIEGTNHFSLETADYWQKLIVNGKPFVLERGRKVFSFTRDAEEWQLGEED